MPSELVFAFRQQIDESAQGGIDRLGIREIGSDIRVAPWDGSIFPIAQRESGILNQTYNRLCCAAVGGSSMDTGKTSSNFDVSLAGRIAGAVWGQFVGDAFCL